MTVERLLTDNASCYRSSLVEAIRVERSIRIRWTKT